MVTCSAVLPVRWCAAGTLCVLCCPSLAYAQATWQVWADATALRLASERLHYEINAEPKTELTTWVSFESTPHTSYAVTPWLDVIGEVDVETDNEGERANAVTVTPRVGAQLHAFSRIIGSHGKRTGAELEPRPRRRLDLRSLMRFEREMKVSGGDTASVWKVRDRFTAAYPLNRMKTTEDGAIYVTSDIEAFVRLDTPVRGGHLSQLRFRSGLGYRRNFGWRFETLYVVNARRNNTSGALEVNAQAIDIKLVRAF
jgi:Protein of unknown function (DUF2490)